MRILNIGSGTEKRNKNTINLDKKKLLNVDIVWNLEKTPLPFEDNYFDVIIANHILEHINNFIPLMEEFHRIMKPKGIIKIRVPYFASPSAFMHPDHKRFFTYKTFDYWLPNEKQKYEVTSNGISFNYVKRELRFDTKFKMFGIEKIANRFPMFYEVLISRNFPAGELYIELEPKK
jgi:SAM-dependent methyltransferase